MAQGLNEYDRIREGLNKIRAINEAKRQEAKLLKEDIGGLDNQGFQAEKEAFQQAVPAQVEFKNFVPGPQAIEIRGVLKIGGPQGLQFLMTTKSADGLYFTCNQFQADESAIDVINKLRAYYDIWYGQSLEKLNN